MQKKESQNVNEIVGNLIGELDELFQKDWEEYGWSWTVKSYYEYLFQKPFPGPENLTVDEMGSLKEGIVEEMAEKAMSSELLLVEIFIVVGA